MTTEGFFQSPQGSVWPDSPGPESLAQFRWASAFYGQGLSRWSEHFQSLFSADRVVQDPAVLRIPQQPFKAELDELPSKKEITKDIEHWRSGKAAGVDGIPPELWKEGEPALHSKIYELLVSC